MLNVPPWEVLLETLSTHHGSVKFVKVPSHVNIIKNNEAERVAGQGRLSHPLCPVLQTPAHQDWSHETPTPQKTAMSVLHTPLVSFHSTTFYTTKAYPRGGGRARSLYATPPSPPPRVLKDRLSS